MLRCFLRSLRFFGGLHRMGDSQLRGQVQGDACKICVDGIIIESLQFRLPWTKCLTVHREQMRRIGRGLTRDWDGRVSERNAAGSSFRAQVMAFGQHAWTSATQE
jgi:hypothetical protein